MMFSEINLGDYLRACAALAAGPDARAAIAALLGLIVEDLPKVSALPVQPPAIPLRPESIPDPSVVPPPSIRPQTPPAPTGRTEFEAPPADDDTPTIPAELTRLERVQLDASIDALDSIPADAAGATPPDIRPLFAPLETRAMLSRALARFAETGPLDLDRLIHRCARREALDRLPRLPQPMLSSGVQLLVDRSGAMTVFARDQERLEASIRALVGEGKLQALSFEGFPSRAGSGGRRRWHPYEEQLPPPGTVVALLTDLGIGRAPWLPTPAAPAQWRSFADRLRRRGCPVVAFVPYPSGRWPAVKHGITIIQWDRRTRTSTIRVSVGRGLRVEQ